MSGAVVWLTGLPASGKTTLAQALVNELRARDVAVLWLDSDALRLTLTPQASYSEAERDWFYATLGHLAQLGAAGGCTVIVSATAFKRSYRDSIRALVPSFVEVWVRSGDRRDPKGLYAAAARGEITALPGAGAEYEPPLAPEVVADTSSEPLDVHCERVLAALAASRR